VAIGRLGSFKTSTTVGLNTNIALYTSTATLSNVTVHVTNQGVEDTIFSIGISSGTAFRNSDFIVFGQTLKKSTYASITNISVCGGETIFTRANKANVNFVAHSVVDYDPSLGNFFGRQESVRTSVSAGPAQVNSPSVLYTAPRAAKVNIAINNLGQDDAAYSIGISSGGLSQFTSADYIIFGQSIPKRTTQIIESIGIGASQSIIIKANDPDVTFVAYDFPVSILEKDTATLSYTSGGGFFGNLIGNVSSSGVSTFNSARVGVLSATTLDSRNITVTGVSTFNNVIVGGAATALVVNDNLTVTGIASIKDLVITNTIKGSALDTTVIAYSILFGS
jgi:hypothetical protein